MHASAQLHTSSCDVLHCDVSRAKLAARKRPSHWVHGFTPFFLRETAESVSECVGQRGHQWVTLSVSPSVTESMSQMDNEMTTLFSVTTAFASVRLYFACCLWVGDGRLPLCRGERCFGVAAVSFAQCLRQRIQMATVATSNKVHDSDGHHRERQILRWSMPTTPMWIIRWRSY